MKISRRWPLIGATGFNAGYKPAMAVSLLDSQKKRRDDGTNYAPITRCSQLIRKSLDITISGVNLCGLCRNFAAPTGSDQNTALVGINGVHKADYAGLIFGTHCWLTPPFGEYQTKTYSEEDCQPAFLIDTTTGPLEIALLCCDVTGGGDCKPPPQFYIFAGPHDQISTQNGEAFNSDGHVKLKFPVANSHALCGIFVIGGITTGFFPLGYQGLATITVHS